MISLSQTLKGLHWDKVPGDNDNEVGARGILYLLIFQQLGQLLRWSWGYNVLLAPADKYLEEDGGTDTSRRLEQGHAPDQRLIGSIYDGEYDSDNSSDEHTRVGDSPNGPQTASTPKGKLSSRSSRSTSRSRKGVATPELLPTPVNGNVQPHQHGPLISSRDDNEYKDDPSKGGIKGFFQSLKRAVTNVYLSIGQAITRITTSAFACLPRFLQIGLTMIYEVSYRFFAGLWEFMNPPLWAMLIAIIVASIPTLQSLFFDDGTFLRNSVTRAIGQSGGVAVPLILVVLGGE